MKKVIYLLLIFSYYSILSSSPLVEKIPFEYARVKMNSIALVSNDFGIAVGDVGIIRTLSNGYASSSYFQIPEKANLHKIVKLDDNTFVCVGENGIIYRTTNAGVDWGLIDSKTTINLNSIAFINKQNGICVGNGGTILRTINGGLDWQKVTGPVTDNLLDISSSATNFYIAGENGTVLKSNADGSNWVKLEVPKLVNYYFISSSGNKLYVMGDSLTVLVSDDFGNTFQTPVLDKNYSKVYKRPTIDSYYFFGSDSGFVKVHDNWADYYRDNEYYTIDGGKNWTKINRADVLFGAKPSNPTCFGFISQNFGIMIDEMSLHSVLSTFPQLSFKKLQKSTYGTQFYDIASADGKNIALTYSPNIGTGMFLSTNSGGTWTQMTVDTIGQYRGPVYYADMTFTDHNTIYLALNNQRDSTWTDGSGTHTLTMKFGFILKSTDFGQSWKDYNFNYKRGISSFSFANKDNGIAYFYKNYIYTTDGGNSWMDGNWPDPTIKTIVNMQCPLPNYHLFVGIPESNVYKMYLSNDKGQTWDSSLVLPQDCFYIKFFSETKIYAYGEEKGPNNGYISLIYETSDNGQTWSKLIESNESEFNFNTNFLRDIQNYSDDNMCGRLKTAVFLTNNGWKDYEELELQELESSEILSDLIYLNDNEILTLGDRGTLLKIYLNKVSVNEYIKNNINSFISPNPASDYITLNIPPLEKRVLGGVLQEMRIFDIFGNNVLSVETGLRPVSTRIDISTLPAGVYFVRIGEKVDKFVKM